MASVFPIRSEMTSEVISAANRGGNDLRGHFIFRPPLARGIHRRQVGALHHVLIAVVGLELVEQAQRCRVVARAFGSFAWCITSARR